MEYYSALKNEKTTITDMPTSKDISVNLYNINYFSESSKTGEGLNSILFVYTQGDLKIFLKQGNDKYKI